MSELEKHTFREVKQNSQIENYYSYYLNILINKRKDNKCSLDMLAKAFNCSKGKLSQFENRIKDYDFKMLFDYAGFFGYKFNIYLHKKKHSEIYI